MDKPHIIKMQPVAGESHSKELYVRHTEVRDLDSVMAIYDEARGRMRAGGNSMQWVNGYPSTDVILNDIAHGNSYVVESTAGIVGVFSFIVGDDPTYKMIEGEWLNTEPYGTIHRIASTTGAKGIADAALSFCMSKGVEIRIDTHADNRPMLRWIAKRGFHHCGIIYVGDGTPRKAFQLPHSYSR